MTDNRWLIAIAAGIIQICLGAAHEWSVFVAPLVAVTGWTPFRRRFSSRACARRLDGLIRPSTQWRL
jgi:hypothetical protein